MWLNTVVTQGLEYVFIALLVSAEVHECLPPNGYSMYTYKLSWP